MHCLGPFSPLPPVPSLFPHPPSLPGRACSALFSNFVEEKIIINNKKDKAFLLVEIRIGIQRFLALLLNLSHMLRGEHIQEV
jgi:hypothetical protein